MSQNHLNFPNFTKRIIEEKSVKKGMTKYSVIFFDLF